MTNLHRLYGVPWVSLCPSIAYQPGCNPTHIAVDTDGFPTVVPGMKYYYLAWRNMRHECPLLPRKLTRRRQLCRIRESKDFWSTPNAAWKSYGLTSRLRYSSQTTGRLESPSQGPVVERKSKEKKGKKRRKKADCYTTPTGDTGTSAICPAVVIYVLTILRGNFREKHCGGKPFSSIKVLSIFSRKLIVCLFLFSVCRYFPSDHNAYFINQICSSSWTLYSPSQ